MYVILLYAVYRALLKSSSLSTDAVFPFKKKKKMIIAYTHKHTHNKTTATEVALNKVLFANSVNI